MDSRLRQEWPDYAVLCWEMPYSLETYEALAAAWRGEPDPPHELEPDAISDVVPGPRASW